MTRFKEYSYEQKMIIPVSFEEQVLPGSFEETLNHVVNEMDLSIFAERYNNDYLGAPAYDPRILLKIILLAYSKGIYYSRRIEKACKENVLFMALSADAKPDHSTIASFISSMEKEIIPVFLKVLWICHDRGLIGGEMFALDGCKFPSNASKEWSGTKKDLKKKKKKIETLIQAILSKHKELDQKEIQPDVIEKEKRSVEHLKAKLSKLEEWLKENEDKQGRNGRINKSNITDNESAKMPSSHGVIQGYNGIAVVDEKHQVILNASLSDGGKEQSSFPKAMELTKENLQDLGKTEEEIRQAKLIADTGFFSKENLEFINREQLDAYVPDPRFRKRDPRFQDADRHKITIKEHKQLGKKFYSPEDFKYDEEKGKLICPAGCELYIRNSNFFTSKGEHGISYKAKITDCRNCKLSSQCLRNPKTKSRQVHFFYGRVGGGLIAKMKEKIDSAFGKFIYSQRMKIVEPVFANLRHNLGLNRFTLRGANKIKIQWNLYAIVHNIFKIWRFSPAVA